MQEASAQIQMLTRSWEEFSDLNTQIPKLKRDLDKASALNAKVGGSRAAWRISASCSHSKVSDSGKNVASQWPMGPLG